jgi:hypothetical protein
MGFFAERDMDSCISEKDEIDWPSMDTILSPERNPAESAG